MVRDVKAQAVKLKRKTIRSSRKTIDLKTHITVETMGEDAP